jgi:hypothetical protein
VANDAALEAKLQLASGEETTMTFFLLADRYDAYYENEDSEVHVTGNWSVDEGTLILENLMTCSQEIWGGYYTEAMLCSITDVEISAEDEVVFAYGLWPSLPR